MGLHPRNYVRNSSLMPRAPRKSAKDLVYEKSRLQLRGPSVQNQFEWRRDFKNVGRHPRSHFKSLGLGGVQNSLQKLTNISWGRGLACRERLRWHRGPSSKLHFRTCYIIHHTIRFPVHTLLFSRPEFVLVPVLRQPLQHLRNHWTNHPKTKLLVGQTFGSDVRTAAVEVPSINDCGFAMVRSLASRALAQVNVRPCSLELCHSTPLLLRHLSRKHLSVDVHIEAERCSPTQTCQCGCLYRGIVVHVRCQFHLSSIPNVPATTRIPDVSVQQLATWCRRPSNSRHHRLRCCNNDCPAPSC